MFDRQHTLAQIDPELWTGIQNENRRQEEHIELIASENYTSPAVMAAQGSQLTNKYAEGYPAKRYYGGCEFVDVAEQLAIDRVKKLFGAEAANVQPHSGASANQAVFLAFLKPGDTFMGMSLAEGGHLSHGMALNMSGKWFNAISYGLDKNEVIDYDQMECLAREQKPKLIIESDSEEEKKDKKDKRKKKKIIVDETTSITPEKFVIQQNKKKTKQHSEQHKKFKTTSAEREYMKRRQIYLARFWNAKPIRVSAVNAKQAEAIALGVAKKCGFKFQSVGLA
jgi:hypothetical protein